MTTTESAVAQIAPVATSGLPECQASCHSQFAMVTASTDYAPANHAPTETPVWKPAGAHQSASVATEGVYEGGYAGASGYSYRRRLMAGRF